LPDLPANPAEFDESSAGEIAFVGQTSAAPPELWMRGADGQAQQVTHLTNRLKRYGLIAPEFYKYKSFDGVEIEAALLKPAGYDGKVQAADHRVGAWRTHGKLARRRGCLGPIARGSRVRCSVSERARLGRLRRKFLEMNRADWGGGDFKDVMSGVEDLVHQGNCESSATRHRRMSYGGYMAEWAVTQTDLFKAAVSGAGMANLISEFGTEKGSASMSGSLELPMNTRSDF